MILIEDKSNSMKCLQSITFCVKDIILDTVSFAWICQGFTDIYTLLEVQLQEARGLDKFHMPSKACMVRTHCLSFHIYTCMHAYVHSFTPSYKYYIFDIFTITS